MPSRIVREGILTSPKIAAIATDARREVLFRRLLNVADDYGRYYAHPALVRSAAYPFSPDIINESEIDSILRDLAAVELIDLYTVEGKDYLEIRDFRQQLRAKRSKFPSINKADAKPTPSTRSADARQTHNDCLADAQQRDEHMCSESHSESHSEARIHSPSTRSADAKQFQPDVDRFQREYPKDTYQLEIQLFIGAMNSPADEVQFFASLAAHKRTPQWEDPRYVPAAKRFISEGMWRTIPVVDDTVGPITPIWRPEDYE